MSEERVICIDIGYSKVAAAIVDSDVNNQPEVLGVGEAPTNGLFRGKVKEVEAVSDSIRNAVMKAFETIGSGKVDRVLVGITGMEIEGLNSCGVAPIQAHNRTITDRDIETAINNAKAVSLPTDRQIFLIGQQQFVIDDKIVSSNPIKMAASNKLEAQVHLLTCLENIKENFERCLIDAGIEHSQIYYSGAVGAEAVLSLQERDLGTLYIDFGKDTIDVLFYKNQSLHYSKVYSFGFNLITNDLCLCYRISYDDAEHLKKEGTAYPLTDSEDLQVYIRGLNGQDMKICRQKEINEVIEARVTELLELIASDFRKSNFQSDLKFGVVLAGGGALQTGIEQCVKKIFGTAVRIAVPEKINGLKASFLTPAYVSLYGLMRFADRQTGCTVVNEDEIRSSRRDGGARRGRWRLFFANIADFFRSFL